MEILIIVSKKTLILNPISLWNEGIILEIVSLSYNYIYIYI